MFSWLDPILGLILLWAIFRGLKQGLVRIIFGFLAIGLGVGLSCRFFGQLAELLAKWLKWSPLILQIISFTVSWLIICWVIIIFGNALRRVIQLTPLGFFDTVGGAVLGLAKGVVFLILIFLPLFVLQGDNLLPSFAGQAIKKSYLVRQASPLISQASKVINHFLPANQIFRQKNVFYLLDKKFRLDPGPAPKINL